MNESMRPTVDGRKVLFIVASQYENYGDSVINKQLVRILSQNAEVVLDCRGVPSGFVSSLLAAENVKPLEQVWGDISFKRISGVKGLLRRSFPINWVVRSPGPLRFELNFGGIKTLCSFFLLYTCLRMRGCKALIIGSDIVVNGMLDALLYKWLAAIGARFLLRDQASVNCINRHAGGTCAKFVPDLSILGFNKRTVERPKGLIGVSLRHEKDLDELVEKLRVLKNSLNCRLELFYQVEADKVICEKVLRRFEGDPEVVLHEPMICEQNEECYDRYGTVVSNRLHVLLIGAMRGCRIASLSLDRNINSKINGVMGSLNLAPVNLAGCEEAEMGRVLRSLEPVPACIFESAKNVIETRVRESLLGGVDGDSNNAVLEGKQ